jgi:hypothetical protein
VFGEAGDLLRRHPGPRRQDEEVVVEALAVDLDAPRVGVDAPHRAAYQLDVTLPGRPRERDQERVELAAEGDVDRVRLEQERVTVRDERQPRPVAQPRTEQERRLEAGEPAADDNDPHGCSNHSALPCRSDLLCQTPALAGANESAFATERGDRVIEAGGEFGGIERRARLRLQPKRDLFTAGLDLHRRKLLVFVGRTGTPA